MYNNLIEEDIMILDNEFFKIDTMFETVDRIYDIKQRELEYNYIYTESINEEYVDLYTEAEAAKDRKEQGLLGRLFTAILNFIRKIRAKILRLFGNDKKAAELEAKIKGNPKLANQTVEITNTTDAEKAIDEGTSFFGSLIDKIIGGKATEKDADEAEEKNKSLLSRIAIFGGGALLAAGGAKVVTDKLKEHGVTKQTIKETVSNLLKREEDTKKKSNEVTQTNEQNVQKAQQAMNNNSQNGNEENTKAGRRIVGSFKDFITDAGKFFTGKASELKSKINGVSSDEQQTSTSQERPKNTNTQQANDDTQQTEQKNLTPDEYYKKTIKSEKQKEFFKFKDENDKMIDEIQDYLVEISRETRLNGQNIISEYDIILKGRERAKPHIPPSMTFEKIKTYNQKLKELLDKSKKEYEDLKSKNNTMSDSFASATAFLSSMEKDKNDESKPENKVEKQPETKSDKPEETESKTKPEDKVEKQPENKTDTTAQKKDNVFKSDITAVLGSSIRNIINLLKITSNIDKNHPPKNVNVYSMKRGERKVYYLLDEAHIYPVVFDHSKDSVKEYLKRIIEHADYLNKIRNNINFDELAEYTNDDDKYGLMEDFNKQYSVINDYLDDAKKNLKEIEEYERQQKSSKTTNESSYDLINDILTIFENSF